MFETKSLQKCLKKIWKKVKKKNFQKIKKKSFQKKEFFTTKYIFRHFGAKFRLWAKLT